jgi:hypothetical protein
MGRVLDSPVHWPLSRWFAVLAWSGRRTGRRYSTPISYIREGDVVFVTTGDRWWRNLSAGAPVGMRIAGRWRQGTAQPILDAAARAEHERLFRDNPWFRSLAGIPKGRDGGPDSTAIARAVAAGRVLIRIHLSATTIGTGGP